MKINQQLYKSLFFITSQTRLIYARAFMFYIFVEMYTKKLERYYGDIPFIRILSIYFITKRISDDNINNRVIEHHIVHISTTFSIHVY